MWARSGNPMYGILALALAAHGFAPSSDVWIGKEPVRLFRTHTPAQLRLRHQPAWVEFVAGQGRGWEARFDQRTGTPHRMWGPGLDLGPTADERQVRRALDRFFSANRSLLGVAPADLAFVSARHLARGDTWIVNYDRLVDGDPVWRAGVTARFKAGKLILLGVDTYPGAAVPEAEIGADEAMEIAALDGPAALADHRGASARRVVLPLDVPGGLDLRRVWEVRSETTAPRGKWVSFVDAVTGELIAVYNEVRFLDGTVYGVHPTRTHDGIFSTSPIPLALVQGEADVYTDAAGVFSVEGDSATTRLAGSYLTVRNDAGDEGQLDFDDAAPTWTTDEATEAEIASYVFLHQVRDWGAGVAPGLGITTEPLLSIVNLDSGTCNAYYDGNVNFYAAGGGCNNTGAIADVNYHEWGHGFHAYSANTWNVDGSVGEGVGDCVAFLQTHDSTIAPYFVPSGSGIREVAGDREYPDDVYGEVHEDGLIFGGSVWDVWEQLYLRYGEARTDEGVAHALVGRLLADALSANPSIESSFDEFVVADDDDGDLSNGTPHYCELAEGFAPHGLGPLADAGGGGLAVDHAALDNQATGVGIELQGEVVNFAGTCLPFAIERAEVRYSLDGGATWESVAASVTDLSFTAEFPEIPDGSIVTYYLHAEGDGQSVTAPEGGEIAPYTFYVGELTELWCANLQDDGGLTHELLSGEDRDGADDWIWAAPGGYAEDPDAAYTGRKVWGNDLGGGNYNGEYQPEVHNRLSTPPIETGAAGQVIVQYRRWLNVEDGVYDYARVLANEEELWANHASNRQVGDEDTQDREWMLATHRGTPTAGTVTVSWEIETDAGKELGGWNLDDICVYAPSDVTVDANAVADFAASDDQVGQVTLTWTQPAVAGTTAAVVLRRDDRFPENAGDGEVVSTLSGLTPGEAVQAIDPFVGHAYYTVLAGGDEGFGAGAVATANADEGTGLATDGDGGGDDVVLTPEGCGCASDAGVPGGSIAAFALAALGLRRRKA